MEQIVIEGASASGTIPWRHGCGIEVRSVEIDLPLDEVGTSDPQVTLSGNGVVQTVHSDTTLNLRFPYQYDVTLSSDNFSAGYSAIIRYVYYGDQKSFMGQRHQAMIPSWTRRTPRSS